MATLLVKNLPEEVLKELKKLKVELGCRTWADLLTKLVEERKAFSLNEDDFERMKAGVAGFLELRAVVSSKWKGPPSVIEEMRKSRGSEFG